jgi:hypothetical protein
MQYTTIGQLRDRVAVYDCSPHNEDLYVVDLGGVKIMTELPQQLLDKLRDAVNQLNALLSERNV